MEFRILGPLEVVQDGRTLTVGGQKPRALLGLLLLRANEVVPADRLISEIWGAEPPETASTMLQIYVSRLRNVLEPGRPPRSPGNVLVTRPPGYAVRVEPEGLDLHRFERLEAGGRAALAEGDPGRAAAMLQDALSLWRGPALADFVYEPFAQPEIARLEELRLAALEERVDADLALGRHAELVSELEGLVREHPLRERLRRQLMLALYRCGRQAEALDMYQGWRRTLVDELGIEPSRALQDLERAILNQDRALDPRPARPLQPATVREQLAVPGAPFVGRGRELDALLAGLDDALEGKGTLVLLSGEPGIGKSRLADELALRASDRCARVLTGRCWEAGGAPAYWPWVQTLRAYVRGADPDALESLLAGAAADLAQILPELRDLFPDMPSSSDDPETARFRLFDATASFLTRAAETRPIVLLLDDVHAADIPSLLLLQFIARQLARNRLLVVVGYRDVDPTLKNHFAATLAELARESVTRLLPLSGLSETDVARFIELSAGLRPSDAVVAAIHRKTEGNPLFVSEVVGLLTAEGQLADVEGGGGADLPIPQGVRAIIGRRLGRLPDKCRRMLTLASVLGREFDLDALSRLSARSTDEVLDLLEDAAAERIVGGLPEVPGRLRFAHALMRDTMYDELTITRRLRLHRRAGEALEALYTRNPEPHLAELAYHFVAAGQSSDPAKAVGYARRAAERAVRLLAYEEAVRLYRMALDAWRLGAAEEIRCELLLALGDAQSRAGDEIAAKTTFHEAATTAEALDDPGQLARAALGYGGRFLWARAGSDPHLIALLERALAALDETDSPLRVRILGRLAGALRDQHSREPRAILSRDAVEMARRLGDSATLAYALEARAPAIMWPENPEERIGIALESARVGESARDLERIAMARYTRLFAELELGDMASVKRGLEAFAALAAELKQPAHNWFSVVTEATLALFEGRFHDGERLINEAFALGQRAQSSDALLSCRVQTFVLRTQQGEFDGLEEMLLASLEDFPARPMFKCMLAVLYADLGRDSDTRVVFEELADDDFSGLPMTNEWLFSLGFLAEAAGYLDERLRAATLYELLLPYARYNACTADYIATGSVSRPLGILAATAGRHAEAERHLKEAVSANVRMGARPWAAHTQVELARVFLAQGRSQNQEQASRLLTDAATAYDDLGMAAWAVRARLLHP